MWNRTPSAYRRILWGVVGFGLSLWVIAILGVFGYERLVQWAEGRRVTVGTSPIDPLFVLKLKGVERPATVEAGASRIGPDEIVIGVVVGGKARAYRLAALKDRARHVVNDNVEGMPITVSYCDLRDCVRAYRGSPGPSTLDVSVAGLYEGREMVLDVGGTLYFQESGLPMKPGQGRDSIPLEGFASTRSTWREWKQAHPDTDVYEGGR